MSVSHPIQPLYSRCRQRCLGHASTSLQSQHLHMYFYLDSPPLPSLYLLFLLPLFHVIVFPSGSDMLQPRSRVRPIHEHNSLETGV